jgi:putative DNA primase/helicase
MTPDTTPLSPNGATALDYARRGWAVFPLHAVLPGGGCDCCTAPCGSTGKHPLTRHGLKDATKEEAAVRANWTNRPTANVGIATGAVSSVVVLDVDPAHGGDESLAKLLAEHGALPETRVVATGGGGRHYYFKHPGGRVPNSAGKLGRGLDVRGDGGYVVAPPSNHVSGGTYRWLDEREPADAPAWLVAQIVAPEEVKATVASKERTDFGVEGGTPYGLQALAEETLEVESTPEGSRNEALNRAAFRIGRLVAGGELDRKYATRRLVEAGVAAGLPQDEAIRTARSGFFKGLRRPRSAPPRKRTPKKEKPFPKPRPIENTDLGNARRLAGCHGHELRHCAALGWFTWDGRRWKKDDTGAAMRFAKDTAELIWDEVKAAAKEDQEEMAGWALASQSAARLEAMLRLAATEARIAVAADVFDRDAWLLNVENGTVNLRTGALKKHDPADHITKLAPVAYDETATCPRFLRFLADVFRGNAELIRFVQKALGYALTGDVSFQVLFFLHGEGSNGKSTLVSVVLHVMGDYASPAAPEILLSRHGERHPTEIADLFGKRLVTCVEVGKGRAFNEALLKWLTGGDRLKARMMRMDFFDFAPTHKIFICANNKPRVRETDHAFWRRMRLVPFLVKFVDRAPGATGEPGPGEKDEFLLDKLKAEAAGILRWMVEGCIALQTEGLAPPKDVEAATEAYRQGEDVLGLFFDECCVLRADARVLKGQLYEAYVAWAKHAGEGVLPMREFRRSLVERGVTETRVHGGARCWVGVGLLDDAAPRGDGRQHGDADCRMNGGSHRREDVNGQTASPGRHPSPQRRFDLADFEDDGAMPSGCADGALEAM